MSVAARTGPWAITGALLLFGCSAPEGTSGPGPQTEGEAQALANAEAMLELRDPPDEQDQADEPQDAAE